MPNPAGPSGYTAAGGNIQPYDPTALPPTAWGYIDPSTPAGQQAHQTYLNQTQGVTNNSPTNNPGGTYSPGGGSPPSSNALGQVGGYPTGQVPIYNPSDLAITGAPSAGPATNYGLNQVYATLQNALGNLGLRDFTVTPPTSTAATGNAAQGNAASYTAAQGGPSGYNAALGGASGVRDVNGMAATGNAAYADPTRVSTAGDLAWQSQQQQLANVLANQAAGGGMSPADIQLKQGTEDSIAAQLAVLGSQRGSSNFALGQRTAADQAAAARAGLNSQMGLQRAQETLAAQQAMGNVLGTARGQAQNYNLNQAQLNQANQQFNAGNLQNMTLADLAAINSQTQQNVGLAQQANEYNAGNAQNMTLANLAAQNQALQYNAGNSQQSALANLLAQNQALQSNAQNAQGMTLANLAAQNQFGLTNVENAQQTDLANQAMAGQYGLANQQAALQANQQYYQQLLGLTGGLGGIADANRAAAAADQQMRQNAALTQYGIDSGVAIQNAQASSNLLGAGLGGSAAILAAMLSASDENLKEGITGGNPMLDSFLEQFRAARGASTTPGTSDQGMQQFERIAKMFGNRQSSDAAGLSAGANAIASGIRGMGGGGSTTPGDWYSKLQSHATPSGQNGLTYVGPADLMSQARSAQDALIDPETMQQRQLNKLDWGQSLDNGPTNPINTSADLTEEEMHEVSDENEKEAVTSGNRGLQAFLEQQGAQTNAQNQQGSYSNAFMQNGQPPQPQVNTQLPQNPNAGYGQPSLSDLLSAGYGGGGVANAGGYWGGGFNPSGMLGQGSEFNADITNAGGFNAGGMNGGPGLQAGDTNLPAYQQLKPVGTPEVGPGQGVLASLARTGAPTPAPSYTQLRPVGTPTVAPGQGVAASLAPSATPYITSKPAVQTGTQLKSVGTPTVAPGLGVSSTLKPSPPLTAAPGAGPIAAPFIAPPPQVTASPSYAGQLATVATSLPRLSDEQQKTSVQDNPEDMQGFLDALHAHSYRYKDPGAPGAGAGRYVSPMAQELEQTDLGKHFVFNDPSGHKMVDYGKMAGTQLAATAMLNERMNKLEDLLARSP